MTRTESGPARQFSEHHSYHPNGHEKTELNTRLPARTPPAACDQISRAETFLKVLPSDPPVFPIFVRQQRKCRCGSLLFPIKSRRNGHPFFATKPVAARRKGIRGKCQLFYSCQPIESLTPLLARAEFDSATYGGHYQIISPSEQWRQAFDRLAGIKKLTFTSDALSTSSYGFGGEKWMPVSPRLYRKEKQSAATLALLPDEDGKVLMESDGSTFKKVSARLIWSQAAGGVLAGSLVLSSVLFVPVWVIRMMFGKLRNAGPLSVRVMPLLGAAFLIVFDVALAIGLRSDHRQ